MADTNNITSELDYRNRQVELLMEILHDLKHSIYEDITSSLAECFPHWRCIEFYGLDKGFDAIGYLFDEVLILE